MTESRFSVRHEASNHAAYVYSCCFHCHWLIRVSLLAISRSCCRRSRFFVALQGGMDATMAVPARVSDAAAAIFMVSEDPVILSVE